MRYGRIIIVFVVLVVVVWVVLAKRNTTAEDVGRETGEAIDQGVEKVMDAADEAGDAVDRQL